MLDDNVAGDTGDAITEFAAVVVGGADVAVAIAVAAATVAILQPLLLLWLWWLLLLVLLWQVADGDDASVGDDDGQGCQLEEAVVEVLGANDKDDDEGG